MPSGGSAAAVAFEVVALVVAIHLTTILPIAPRATRGRRDDFSVPATLRPKRSGRSLLQQLVNRTGRLLRYVTFVKVVRYQIVTRVNYLSPALILKDLDFRPLIRRFMAFQHTQF